MNAEHCNPHCCDSMATHLREQDVPIVYSPRFGEYGLKVMDGGSAKQLIQFCPWCGKRLPESLRDAWFRRLEQLQIEPDDSRLPDEMKGDAWWRGDAATPNEACSGQDAMQLLSKCLPEVRRKFAVQSLAFFGSAARKEDTQDSDIDVLVEFSGKPTFDHYMGLKLYLEDLFGRPVDLVIASDLRPALRPRIEQEALHVT